MANLLKKLEAYKAKVQKFNSELEEYFKVSGENSLPIIECTIYGFDDMELATITDMDNGFACELDGMTYEVKIQKDEDGEIYIDGWDMSFENPYDTLREALQYEKRRLSKAWRIWRSENPDAELEKDDEE